LQGPRQLYPKQYATLYGLRKGILKANQAAPQQ
jgi:hypothetical protein